MNSQRIVSALLLVAPIAMVSASTTYEGYGTVYTLTEPSSGNCNFMSAPTDATTKYAALNADQWDKTMNCGRCAEVTCTDASCSGQSSEVVYIMDQCPGCEYGDLDLSPDVFESITGQSYTKLSIEWKFVDCPISNNVQYCLKTGSSEFWVAVQPANFVSGVQSLSINGQETTVIDSAYYFLIDGSGESVADLSSVSISLTGVNGQVLEETLSLSADECTDGSSQFTSSGDVSQSTTTTQTSTSTAAPTSAPSTAAPNPVPTTEAPKTEAPTAPIITTAPSVPTTAARAPEPSTGTPEPTTGAPTSPPTTEPPTTAPVMETPVTDAPTATPTAMLTVAPTTSPAATAPVTEEPTELPTTTVPVTKAPVTDAPTTATPTPTPPSTPVQAVTVSQSASTSSDGITSTSSSVDQETLTMSTEAGAVETNSTSTTIAQDSGSASIATEDSIASTTKASSSTSTQTSTTVQSSTSTPTATEASVQEEASSSGGLHSTAASVGLIAAVCAALGAVVGVAVVVRRKRKLLEENKNAEDRDRTPPSAPPSRRFLSTTLYTFAVLKDHCKCI